ncbi:MAG: hypothetical protein GVY31_10625 [Alphaproteobacteria bacterium]|jgi:hypothetical protein|nr:hypothetical protein [Alphaproteobacteria bacterium]
MLLDHTISQLDTGPMPPDRACQMGQLGYMQWIAGLPGEADYCRAARRALARAADLRTGSPAVEAFCQLVETSLATPLAPLPLSMPPARRRGGARARRVDRHWSGRGAARSKGRS